MSTPSPTSDLALTLTYDPTRQLLVADIPLTPSGDYATVIGVDRLVQDLSLYLLTRAGMDLARPDVGNRFLDNLGQPVPAALAVYEDQLTQALDDFTTLQAADAAAGNLAQDELLDTFTLTLTLAGGVLTAAISGQARGGDGFAVQVPLS